MTDRLDDGRFKKGVSGNPAGRRKTDKSKELRKVELLEMIDETAQGNSVIVMELMLKHASELDLSVSDRIRIAKDLAPYQKGKVATVNKENERDKNVTVMFDSSLSGDDNDE